MSFFISSRVYPIANLVAILAIGKPVALEASALDRETRGFISITMMRPLSGLTANWILQPPVATPTSRIISIDRSRNFWNSTSVSVNAGATVMESPVWTPIGSIFSMLQTITTLSDESRITSSSYSFQPKMDSSRSTSDVGLCRKPAPAICRRVSSSNAIPEPSPPIVNEGRTTTG